MSPAAAIRRHPPPPGNSAQMISVGDYALWRVAGDRYRLMNGFGEMMETGSDKLEIVLAAFFALEF